MLRVAALAIVTALAGCTVKDPCAAGTVLVSLTLDGDAANADELVIDVALDGDAPRESTLAHTPGVATGNVVVKFPSGYPRGHTVTVAVAARAAGVVIGSTSGSLQLAAGCEALPLAVTPDVVADLAAPAGSDLTPPADVAQCQPTTENCFNGIDDDCDGHIDCDDPDCTTIAVCVPPVTGAFVVGTTVVTTSLCPTSYSKLEDIMSGLSAPACSTGCGCSMTCQTQIGQFGGTSGGCSTDTENQIAVAYSTMCSSWNVWDSTVDVHMLVTPTTCQASGPAQIPPSSWAASRRVCSTAVAGGGCSGGNLCVPITPGPSCEVAAGSQTCDPGYTAVPGPWYTGKSDTRGCSCSCGAPTSGSCGTTVTLHTDKNCLNGATAFSAAATNNITCGTPGQMFFSARIENTAVTCGSPSYVPAGSLTGTGQQTLCCVP